MEYNSTQTEHLLHRKWVFWMHEPCYYGDYEKSRKKLHDEPIDTVENFWRYYNNIPEPSKFFYRDGERKSVGGVLLEGWSFFEDGVKPDWEDSRNSAGSTLTFKSSFSQEETDHVWKITLLGLIGETIPESGHITGIRIIDRGSSYRLEVWLDVNDPTVTNQVKEWLMENVLSNISKPVTCFHSSHQKDTLPTKSCISKTKPK